MRSALLVTVPSLLASVSAQTVPLRLWTDAANPNGVTFSTSYGVAVGDYDADGWVDMFQSTRGTLWRNLQGQGWQLAANLNSLLPTAAYRYSSSLADYDLDGRVDIALEPYINGGDACLRVLHNLDNAGGFAEVGGNSAIIIGQPCGVSSETICWGDVDGDGWLDFVLPTYPTTVPGNFFFHSLGPTGAGGAVRFQEKATTVGVKTTPWCVRPEGAEFIDIDRDGDLDFYSNATLYLSRSSVGNPVFDALQPVASGLASTGLDEGATFIDYDMDGDLDLILQLWLLSQFFIYENRGDATFFQAEAGIVDQPTIAHTGMSAEDWDNDGDLDVTNYNVMRRNDLVETGNRRLTVAPIVMPDLIPGIEATPAWLDWDHDGDMDCILGRFGQTARFYDNTLYGPTTPLRDRRYVRIRPAKDGIGVRGSEVEFGARAEIVLRNPVDARVRQRIATSAGGYINQSWYPLHFGLPTSVAFEDLVFDVVVDFPAVGGSGAVRVDSWVNPALGGIHLANLVDREITVLRSGRVLLNGTVLPPVPGHIADLATTSVRPPVPTVGATLPSPTPTVANYWTGTAVSTVGLDSTLLLREVVVDGVFAAAVPICGGAANANLVLFELQNGQLSALVPGCTAAAPPQPRNNRAFVPVAWQLQPGRQYAVVARVASERRSTSGTDNGGLTVVGALSFVAGDPCAAAVVPDPTRVSTWLRWSKDLPGGYLDLGAGVAGTNGIPRLVGNGTPAPGKRSVLAMASGRPSALAFLVAGQSAACTPVLAGVLVPAPDLVVGGYLLDATGAVSQPVTWPPSLRSAYFQMVVLDPAATSGLAASNALLGATQ